MARAIAMAMLPLLPCLLLGCPEPVPPRPDPGDGGVVTCDEYCRHLRMVCAEMAKPTREGATCETVCENLAGSGYVQNARSCTMGASSCAGVRACEE